MKNILPRTLEAVFLDFDGVVLESADIKTQAFYELYLPYGVEVAENAKNYHVRYQGISRYKKFEEIHKLYLNRKCDLEETNKLSLKFSEIIFQKIIECPFVEGAIAFLEAMKLRNIPVFLLSATPHEELRSICDKRGITHFFTALFGAPYEKRSSGEKIIHNYQFNRENIVFVGDSANDFNASSSIAVPFIGRIRQGFSSPFGEATTVIENFKNLL